MIVMVCGIFAEAVLMQASVYTLCTQAQYRSAHDHCALTDTGGTPYNAVDVCCNGVDCNKHRSKLPK
jgi:hypothetical protein